MIHTYKTTQSVLRCIIGIEGKQRNRNGSDHLIWESYINRSTSRLTTVTVKFSKLVLCHTVE